MKRLADDMMSDLMTDTITVEPFVSRDGYGKPSFGPAVPYPCRITGGSVETVSGSGVEDINTVAFFVPGHPPISAGDRASLPASFNPSSVFVHRVEILNDERGPHHLRVVCGWEKVGRG